MMKKGFLAVGLALAVSGCTSVESATVASNEVTATGGEAVAVIQASSLGWTLIFHIVDIVTSDLDQVVNKLLVGEAKAMGASKVDLKSASTTPRHGIFALAGFITGTVIVTVVYMVPVLGGIVFLLIKPLALGAMLIAAVEGFRRERPAPPNVPPPTQPATPIPPPVLAPAPTANLNAAVGASPAVSAARKTENMPPIIGQSRSRSNDFASEDLASMTRVGFWPRLGATFLDFVPIMIICGPMLRSNELFLLAWIAYHVGMWTWRGTTLGGIVFSLRVVRLDGRPLDFTVAVVRALGSCLSFVVACLGFFWASWNPDKQSWHDMIAGTVIVKTPRSVPLV